MTRTDFYLTRHGETEWNRDERLQGRKDSPLTALGEAQAIRLRSMIASVHLDVIYSSPSPRAARTAAILGEGREVPIVLSTALLEIDLGGWEGRLGADLALEFPEEYRIYRSDPAAYRSPVGGESFYDVRRRVLEFWHSLGQGRNVGKHVLLVTHTIPLKLIMADAEGRPLKQLWDPPFAQQASLSHVALEGDAYKILRYAETAP